MITNNETILAVMGACIANNVSVWSISVIGDHVEFKVSDGRRLRFLFQPASANFRDISQAAHMLLRESEGEA